MKNFKAGLKTQLQDLAADSPIHKKNDRLSAKSFGLDYFTTVYLICKSAFKDIDKGFFRCSISPGSNYFKGLFVFDLNHQCM